MTYYTCYFRIRERRRGKRMVYWRQVRDGELVRHPYRPVDIRYPHDAIDAVGGRGNNNQGEGNDSSNA